MGHRQSRTIAIPAIPVPSLAAVRADVTLDSIPSSLVQLIAGHLPLSDLCTFRSCSHFFRRLVDAAAPALRPLHWSLHVEIRPHHRTVRAQVERPSELRHDELQRLISALPPCTHPTSLHSTSADFTSRRTSSALSEARSLLIRRLLLSTDELLSVLYDSCCRDTVDELCCIAADWPTQSRGAWDEQVSAWLRSEVRGSIGHGVSTPLLPRLRHVAIYGRWYGRQDTFAVERLLELIGGQRLRSLILCRCDSLQPDRLFTQISALQSLEYLSLAGCSLLSLAAFFALPASLPRLQLLDLNLDRHNDAEAARPTLSVADVEQLRRIAPLLTSLACNGFGARGLKQLRRAFGASLQELAMIDCVLLSLPWSDLRHFTALQSVAVLENTDWSRRPHGSHAYKAHHWDNSLTNLKPILTLRCLIKLTLPYPYMDDNKLRHLCCRMGTFVSLRCLEIVSLPLFLPDASYKQDYPCYSDSTLLCLVKPSSFVVPDRSTRQGQRQAWRVRASERRRLNRTLPEAATEVHRRLLQCFPGFSACPVCPELRPDFPFPALECLSLPWAPCADHGLTCSAVQTFGPCALLGAVTVRELRRCYEYEQRDEWEREQETVGLGEWRRSNLRLDPSWARYEYSRQGSVDDEENAP